MKRTSAILLYFFVFFSFVSPLISHAAQLVTYPRFHVESAGEPLASGVVYTYQCGTTTAVTTCADRDCVSSNGTSVTLDTNGEADIFYNGCLKINVLDMSGTQVDGFPQDYVYGAGYITPADGISLSETYDGDISAAITSISTDEVTLVCDDTVTIPDGETDTLNTNTIWEIRQGCVVQGVAGGGTETLNVKRVVGEPGIEWVGSNVTVSGMQGTVYADWFNDADTGAKVNRAIAASDYGSNVVVTSGIWWDQSYSTGIVENKAVNLIWPGLATAVDSYKAHYTGSGAAIAISASRARMSGDFGLDFTGGDGEADGLYIQSSDAIIDSNIAISDASNCVVVGDDSALAYGNKFDGNLRCGNFTRNGIKLLDLGGGKPNRNHFTQFVSSNSVAQESAVSVTSLSQAAGTATAAAAGNDLEAGDVATIAGADQAGFNGSFIVLTVNPGVSFTFKVDSTTTSPATGTITVTREQVAINNADGFATLITEAYPQSTTTAAWAVACGEANGITLVQMSNETDNSMLADNGVINHFGGKLTGTPRSINGASLNYTSNNSWQPEQLRPTRLIGKNTAEEIFSSSTSPSIYSSYNSGGSFPFNSTGNWVYEAKSGGYGHAWFSNNPLELTMYLTDGLKLAGDNITLDALGTPFKVHVGSGTPEGAVAGNPGDIYRNTSGTGGEYIQYDKKTGTGNTGWVGVGTQY